VETDTTYYVGENDYTVVVTDQDSPTTYVFLPPSVGIKGRIYVIKNFSNGNITVKSPSGSYIEDISGTTGFTVGSSKSIMVQSNGSNRWYIIAHRG